MLNGLGKLPETRILVLLLTIISGIYLFNITWSFLAIFSDIFLILILSWLLAFILEPAVKFLTLRGLSRTVGTIIVYFLLVFFIVVAGAVLIPTVVNQFTVLVNALPTLFENAPEWATRFQEFIANTLSNSIAIAQSVASTIFGVILIVVVSFYFLTERETISRLILEIIPDSWEKQYLRFENIINTSFAGFLRLQVAIGLIIGIATFLILLILRVNYALATSVAAAVFAMVPVIGPFLAVVPPTLSAFVASTNLGLITLATLILSQQIIYNVIAPKMIGETMKIHPIVVLFSFVVGYKLWGPWGSVFAVPIVSALAIIIRETLFPKKLQP